MNKSNTTHSVIDWRFTRIEVHSDRHYEVKIIKLYL